MLLHTVMPIEEVLAGYHALEQTQYVELELGGRRVVVAPQTGGWGRVVRLISTDPMDYLDPRWQPGATMSLYAPR